VWDLTIEPGDRLPPHEHMYDYEFEVCSPRYWTKKPELYFLLGGCAKHVHPSFRTHHPLCYAIKVLEGSMLAVYSGQDGKHMFSFEPKAGDTMRFERKGTQMHDLTGAIPPFDAIHGVKNIGQAVYREILTETKPPKPCKDAPPSPRPARPFRRIEL
jgi:hypothetical protein